MTTPISAAPLIPRDHLFGNPTRSGGRISPDGKLLVGDFLSHGSDSTPRTGITRLNADGTTDTSFNPGTGTGTTQKGESPR